MTLPVPPFDDDIVAKVGCTEASGSSCRVRFEFIVLAAVPEP